MPDYWDRLIYEACAREGRDLLARHLEWQRTSQCPPTPRFLARHRNGDWDQRDKDHFATSCPWCQRQLRLAARLENEARPLPVKLNLVSLAPALGSWMGGGSAVAPVPAGELRWHLEPAAECRVETRDGPAVRLPDEVARRSYAVAEGVAVNLRIDLLLEPAAGAFVPRVEVSPGPHKGKEPLRLVLRFGEGCEREFVLEVAADALVNKPVKLRSAPAEALPADVVSAWTTGGEATSLTADFRGAAAWAGTRIPA